MGRSGRRGSSSSDAIWQEEKNFLANAENIFLLFFPLSSSGGGNISKSTVHDEGLIPFSSYLWLTCNGLSVPGPFSMSKSHVVVRACVCLGKRPLLLGL